MDTTSAIENGTMTTTGTPSFQDENVLSLILNILIGVLLAVIMVGMGCAVQLAKVKNHLKKPNGVLTGFICQFGLMPLIAYLLSLIFSLPDAEALALLIQATCPGGSSSNIATYWMQGDMDLSITMTVCSSLLALGMMPLLLFLYSQSFNEELQVPYDTIAITLATLIVPIGIGVFIRYKFPTKAKTVLKVCSIGGIVVISAVAVISIVTYGGAWIITIEQIFSALLLPVVGMILGYGVSSLVSLYRPWHLRHYQRRTVSMETGIQNTQLSASVIILSMFPLEQTAQMILVPLLYAISQVFWAIVFVGGYRIYVNKFKTRDESSIENEDHKHENEQTGTAFKSLPSDLPPTYEESGTYDNKSLSLKE